MIRSFAIALLILVTNMTFADDKKVEWIAHRGESYIAPENTLASFKLTWQLGGADAGETDIHLTKDNQLIISHDKDTKRTCGQELIIKDSTLDELRRLDAGSWKDSKYAGEKLPTLSEALALIPPGKRFFVEIKVGPEAVPELVRCVKQSGKTAEQIVVISFNADALDAAKKALPHHKCYFLSGFKQDKETKKWTPSIDELISTAKTINADGLDLQSKPPLTASAIAKIKAAGLACYAWTVDDPAEARKLIEGGIEGITTNRATWLREQIEHPTTAPAK